MRKILKKMFVLSTVCFVCGALTLSAAAVNLGTLSYWYSDKSKIGRWVNEPDVYRQPLSANFSTTLISACARAQNQWSANAGIGFAWVTSSDDADIICYGGTVIQLVDAGVPESTVVGVFGHTKHSAWDVEEGTYTYGNTSIDGKTMTRAEIYIVDMEGRTLNNFKKTTIHEFGHALGWFGHSSNVNYVMTQGNSSVITLTAADKNHLTQVY